MLMQEGETMSDYNCVKHTPPHRVNMYGMGCPEEQPAMSEPGPMETAAIQIFGAEVRWMPGSGHQRIYAAAREQDAERAADKARIAELRRVLERVERTFSAMRSGGGVSRVYDRGISEAIAIIHSALKPKEAQS